MPSNFRMVEEGDDGRSQAATPALTRSTQGNSDNPSCPLFTRTSYYRPLAIAFPLPPARLRGISGVATTNNLSKDMTSLLVRTPLPIPRTGTRIHTLGKLATHSDKKEATIKPRHPLFLSLSPRYLRIEIHHGGNGSDNAVTRGYEVASAQLGQAAQN